MPSPEAVLRLPSGELVTAAPDAVVGRSTAAAVRVDDPRVSTVHAELSWRADGFVLIARGGRLRVAGRAVSEVVLAQGLVVELAPAVALTVVALRSGQASVVPPTEGRERLVFRVGPAEVSVVARAIEEPLVRLTGVPARILAELLREPGAARPWDDVAEAIWPDESAVRRLGRPGGWLEVDERRLRNRWDQALRALRQQLAAVRGGALVETGGGTVAVRLGPADRVEGA